MNLIKYTFKYILSINIVLIIYFNTYIHNKIIRFLPHVKSTNKLCWKLLIIFMKFT